MISYNLEIAWAAQFSPCHKKTYTKKMAKVAVKIMQDKYGDHGLAPYRCKDCSYWHIGHPTPIDKLRKRGVRL